MNRPTDAYARAISYDLSKEVVTLRWFDMEFGTRLRRDSSLAALAVASEHVVGLLRRTVPLEGPTCHLDLPVTHEQFADMQRAAEVGWGPLSSPIYPNRIVLFRYIGPTFCLRNDGERVPASWGEK